MTLRKQADVLLLAAGYGKRLRPITEKTPKPLICVAGRPLIDWNLRMIARSGFRRVFVNLFYLKEELLEYLKDGREWNLEIVCVEEDELLDTGGAIRNIEPMMQTDTLLTVNSDTLFGPDFSLRSVLEAHREDALATLVLRKDADAKSYGEVGIDGSGRISSFLGTQYRSETAEAGLMYAGVQAVSRKIVDFMPAQGSVFSITQNTYVKVLKNGRFLNSYCYGGYWNDVGTPKRLSEALIQVPVIFTISLSDISE